VADKYRKLYAGKPGVPNAAFWGMVTNIDENMGRLMAKPDQWGLAENTILIFLTDNGTSAGVGAGRRGGRPVGFNAGMRGKKGSFHEGGHRVPCFVRWPGKLGRPRDVDALTCCQDLLPTLAALCGLKPPAGRALDGVDISPLLKDLKVDWGDRTLVVQYSQSTTPPPKGRAAVLTERWRMVGKQLFDIQADPGQKTDVAARHPDVVKRLQVHYEKWWREVSKRFGEVSHIVIGSEKENPAELSSFDWHGQRRVPWSQGAVGGGSPVVGYWAVRVERAGTYEISLRRWPASAKTPITAAAPGGKAVRVTKARLRIAGVDVTQAVTAKMAAATFTVKLPAGKTRLETWLVDEKSRRTSGAYYVGVRRL
jgi:hypothetical protein